MKENLPNKSVFVRVLTIFLILSLLAVPACVQAPPGEQDITKPVTSTAVSEEPETADTKQHEAETEPAEDKGSVSIRPTGDVVYPYIDSVKAYLEAGEDADIVQFMKSVNDQHKDVEIAWDYTGKEEVSSFVFEYSQNEDLSGGVSVTLSGSTFKRKLTNLYKSAKYYVRVTAITEKGSVSDTSSFSTTSLGPRILNVGGHYGNVRDMGGYVTADGYTVLQDKAFRGSALDNCVDADQSTLNTIGKRFFNDEVKIKTEIDFRGTSENCGRTTPALQCAENYIQVPIVNFQGAFYKDQAGLYLKVFRVFADENNYPIYFHCAAGADRTGTVAAILLALLGVDRTEIIQDFEITSFSKVGIRPKTKLFPVLDNLDRFNGETLSEKTENYLISIGMTKREIYNIKAIMLGLDPEGFSNEKTYELKVREFQYSTAKGGDLKLALYDEADIASISYNGKEIPFTQDGKNVTVKEKDLKNMGKGSFICRVAFADGNYLKFCVMIDEADITDGIKVTHLSAGPSGAYYTYVFLSYPYGIFDGVEYHFHSRPDEFPSIEENILINGVSVKELNKQDMSKYSFAEYPGNSMDRHKVPIDMLCQGNTVSLLIHTGWLAEHFGGKELNIILKKEFEFTNNGVRYYMSRDKSFISRNTSFRES